MSGAYAQQRDPQPGDGSTQPRNATTAATPSPSAVMDVGAEPSIAQSEFVDEESDAVLVWWAWVVIGVVVLALVLGLVGLVVRRRRRRRDAVRGTEPPNWEWELSGGGSPEFPGSSDRYEVPVANNPQHRSPAGSMVVTAPPEPSARAEEPGSQEAPPPPPARRPSPPPRLLSSSPAADGVRDKAQSSTYERPAAGQASSDSSDDAIEYEEVDDGTDDTTPLQLPGSDYTLTDEDQKFMASGMPSSDRKKRRAIKNRRRVSGAIGRAPSRTAVVTATASNPAVYTLPKPRSGNTVIYSLSETSGETNIFRIGHDYATAPDEDELPPLPDSRLASRPGGLKSTVARNPPRTSPPTLSQPVYPMASKAHASAAQDFTAPPPLPPRSVAEANGGPIQIGHDYAAAPDVDALPPLPDRSPMTSPQPAYPMASKAAAGDSATHDYSAPPRSPPLFVVATYGGPIQVGHDYAEIQDAATRQSSPSTCIIDKSQSSHSTDSFA